MATNLSWTSALGDAYFNIPQSVMNAVQVMRQRAQQSGNLKSTQQQTVTVQNQAPGSAPPPPASSGEPQTTVVVPPPPQTIIIQPAQPDVVYVPDLQSDRRVRSSGAGVSRILNRGHGRYQLDLVRSWNRGGRSDQRRRRVLRMGLEFVGMRLA